MIALFQKDIPLNRLSSISFTLAGVVNNKSNLWFMFYGLYQLINNFFLASFGIAQVIIGGREMKDIVAALSGCIAGSLVVLKWFRLNSKRKEVRSIFDKLEVLRLKMVVDEESKQLLTEAEAFGRKISTKMIVFYYIAFPLVAFIFATISDVTSDVNEYQLVLMVWVPWSRDKLWVQILTNGWLTLLTISCLSIYAAFLIMEITFCLYVSAYTASLQNELMNTGIGNGEIIVQYKNLIQLINDYNELLSGQMYIETLIAPLMPCGYGLAGMKALQQKDFSQSFQSIVRSLSALLPCTVSCYFGQLILTQMERLHQATYMSNWYEKKPRIRKDLLMLMIRTTKPKSINYRLFTQFDHILLSVVLQVIYSYFMLMINLDRQ